MHTKSEVEGRYLDSLANLKQLTIYSHEISSSLTGKGAPEEREYYASIIFGKITTHAVSLLRNTPRSLALKSDLEAVVWDVSSVCAMVRALIESFDALAYVAIHPISKESRKMRICFWELHDKERRLKMLKLIGSKSLLLQEMEREVHELRAQALSSPAVGEIHSSVRGKISKGECPDFLHTLKQRNNASQVSHTYYLGARIFFSSYVHTHPFAVHQLANFKAGDVNSLNLISVSVRYALAFLAKAIEGMRTVFGRALPEADASTYLAVQIWCGIAENGVQDSG